MTFAHGFDMIAHVIATSGQHNSIRLNQAVGGLSVLEKAPGTVQAYGQNQLHSLRAGHISGLIPSLSELMPPKKYGGLWTQTAVTAGAPTVKTTTANNWLEGKVSGGSNMSGDTGNFLCLIRINVTMHRYVPPHMVV